VIADLVLAAAVSAGPAVVAIVVGISAAVCDAVVVLAMFVRAAADWMAVIADLVLAARHPAAAAVVPVAPDVGLATVADVVVAVRPTGMAGRDVAGAVVARRAGVVGGAAVSACAAVPVVVVRVRAGAVARRLAAETCAHAHAGATGLAAAAGLPASAAVRAVALQTGAGVAASRVAVVADDSARDPAVVRSLAGVVFASGVPRRRACDASVPTAARATGGANEDRRRSCQRRKPTPALVHDSPRLAQLANPLRNADCAAAWRQGCRLPAPGAVLTARRAGDEASSSAPPLLRCRGAALACGPSKLRNPTEKGVVARETPDRPSTGQRASCGLSQVQDCGASLGPRSVRCLAGP